MVDSEMLNWIGKMHDVWELSDLVRRTMERIKERIGEEKRLRDFFINVKIGVN